MNVPLVEMLNKLTEKLFGYAEPEVNGSSFEDKYNGMLARAIELDEEYTRMTHRYIDGRINRAQDNYYRTHPQSLSWYYIAVQHAWRCWSLQHHMKNDAPLPASSRTKQQIESSTAAQDFDDTYWQSAPSVWSHLGRLQVTKVMIDAIRDDRARIKQDIADERSIFRPSRDWWRDVNVESDELLRSALDEWLPKACRVAVFGSTVPIAEVECLDRGASKVVSLGPGTLQFDCEGIVGWAEQIEGGAEKPVDCLIVSEHIASMGMEPSETSDTDADLKQLASLKESLVDLGLLVLVLPTASSDDAILNIARIYGPRRLERVFKGFELKKSYRPRSAAKAPNKFAICVYVLQKICS